MYLQLLYYNYNQVPELVSLPEVYAAPIYEGHYFLEKSRRPQLRANC